MNLFDLNLHTNASFNAGIVTRRARGAFEEPLRKFAAFVWRRAKTSIRKPRRMRFEELSAAGQRIFEARKREAQRGGPVPVLPYAPSRPGEPPRSPTGILRDTMIFAVDIEELTAVIGPSHRSSKGQGVPSVLEFGGNSKLGNRTVDIEPRPFMEPALEAEASNMVPLFEGCF